MTLIKEVVFDISDIQNDAALCLSQTNIKFTMALAREFSI